MIININLTQEPEIVKKNHHANIQESDDILI